MGPRKAVGRRSGAKPLRHPILGFFQRGNEGSSILTAPLGQIGTAAAPASDLTGHVAE